MKGRLLLILIVAIFVAPILLAWAFVAGLFDWRGQGMLNKGVLLREPVMLAQPLGEPARVLLGFNGTWSILYLGDGDCGQACLSVLDNLHKVYELTGHEQTRVRLFFAQGGSAGGRPFEFPEFTGLALAPGAADRLAAAVYEETGVRRPLIGLVDHRGALMMVYRGSADPRAILDDLRRLLRASDTG